MLSGSNSCRGVVNWGAGWVTSATVLGTRAGGVPGEGQGAGLATGEGGATIVFSCFILSGTMVVLVEFCGCLKLSS